MPTELVMEEDGEGADDVQRAAAGEGARLAGGVVRSVPSLRGQLEAAPLIAAVAKQHKHVLANHLHLKDVLDFRCCDKLCCRCAGWCCNARAP